MSNEAPSSHYWSPVTDQASAHEAIKMAGLPVLVMAFDTAVVALTLFVRIGVSSTVMWLALAIALILVIAAFRLRAGHAGYMPFIAALFPAFLVLVILSSFSGPAVAGGWVTEAFLIATSWIVPVLSGVLAFRGLRGWMWMRAHKLPLSY